MLEKIITQVHRQLLLHAKTIAVAESCSGGLLSTLLTQKPGSSAYFLLGVSAYSNKAKSLLLNIPSKAISSSGAVSRKVAILMAQNIRKKINADFALSITGIAGPQGKTATKPIGTVFISLASKNKTFCNLFVFRGNRASVRRQAACAALQLLIRNLN